MITSAGRSIDVGRRTDMIAQGWLQSTHANSKRRRIMLHNRGSCLFLAVFRESIFGVSLNLPLGPPSY